MPILNATLKAFHSCTWMHLPPLLMCTLYFLDDFRDLSKHAQPQSSHLSKRKMSSRYQWLMTLITHGTEQNPWHTISAHLTEGLSLTVMAAMQFSFGVYRTFLTWSLFASLTLFFFSSMKSLKVEIRSVTSVPPLVHSANSCTYLVLRRCSWPWSFYEFNLWL